MPLPVTARVDGSLSGNGIVPTLLFSEPLPLSVGATPVPGCSVLHEFLRKALKLMSFRLALMVDSFDFAPLDGWSVYNSIMAVLEHTVFCQTHLLYNRHIDQLVLSALYGYCKVHKINKVRTTRRA
jgi:retinoblastoma-like protein 1